MPVIPEQAQRQQYCCRYHRQPVPHRAVMVSSGRGSKAGAGLASGSGSGWCHFPSRSRRRSAIMVSWQHCLWSRAGKLVSIGSGPGSYRKTRTGGSRLNSGCQDTETLSGYRVTLVQDRKHFVHGTKIERSTKKR